MHTTDGHTAYPQAIAEVLSNEVIHQTCRCTEHPIEQDHRGIKQRYYPLLGFGDIENVRRFCRTLEEIRQWLRPQQSMGDVVSLADRRQHVLNRVEERRSDFALRLLVETVKRI